MRVVSDGEEMTTRPRHTTIDSSASTTAAYAFGSIAPEMPKFTACACVESITLVGAGHVHIHLDNSTG